MEIMYWARAGATQHPNICAEHDLSTSVRTARHQHVSRATRAQNRFLPFNLGHASIRTPSVITPIVSVLRFQLSTTQTSWTLLGKLAIWFLRSGWQGALLKGFVPEWAGLSSFSRFQVANQEKSETVSEKWIHYPLYKCSIDPAMIQGLEDYILRIQRLTGMVNPHF